MAKKVIPQTDIFNYKSKEFLLNLNPKDIPPKSSLYYDDFILYEEEKCITGVNINGIHIPGSLYFELNHWKIKLDVLDKYGNIVKEIGHPKLKDNSWIIHNAFNEVDKKKLILIIAGSRQQGKTVTITSLLGRQMTLFPNTFSLGLYSSSKDQEVNAGYLETGLENLEYLKIPRLDKNWKSGQIRLGYKQIDNTDEVWSTLYMRNTDEGKNTESGAGTTLNFFVFDEIAKSPVSKAMEAVKPAMISEFGRRGASVYCFTGGDVLKSKDAENLFLNPKANDVLEFENEGKKTGLFLGGWYRQDFKKEQTLSDYLKVKTNSELDEIKIQVTDFDLANSTLDKEQELLRTDPDKSKLLKHKMYYPRSINEMFLSENENPFPREVLEQQKQFLLANPIGQNIELFRGINGKVNFKFSSKYPIVNYPISTGTTLDAPIVMYDSPEKFKGQKGIHVLGVDTFNDDEAPNSDSLGSIYVFRKFHSDVSDSFNGCMVASYTARPKTMKEFNETVLMLTEFYDAQIMYEHTGGAFKDFFEGKNKLHFLIDTPSLTKEISPNSKSGNTKGLRATPGIQKHALNLSLDYCNEDLVDGKLGVTRLLDPVLLEELLAYDGSKNVDRYIAFSMGMEALYMYKKYTTIVNYQNEEKQEEIDYKTTSLGTFKRGNKQARNPFNI